MICGCGCGQETEMITKTDTRQGRVRGQYNRFIHNHKPLRNDGRRTVGDYQHVLVKEDHPYFSMARKSSTSSYYIPEHRLVMSEWIGRALWDEEVVHHYNSDPTDNRIENLGLFHNQSAHMKYHNKLRKETNNG